MSDKCILIDFSVHTCTCDCMDMEQCALITKVMPTLMPGHNAWLDNTSCLVSALDSSDTHMLIHILYVMHM